MLENLHLEKIFFIDIETVPAFRDYQAVPEPLKILWNMKSEHIKSMENLQGPEELYRRAGIYAEFGKVICISVGIISKHENDLHLRIKSLSGHDEHKILTGFIELINDRFKPGINFLCAHNGREFDFPYLARRIIVNGLKVPEVLDIAGKKPWEVAHLLDTMQLWRFGDVKNYTSLDLLCNILDIPTPKNDIQGKDVWKVYWEENDLERIVKYCEKDVLAIARLMMKFKGMDLIPDENVIRINV